MFIKRGIHSLGQLLLATIDSRTLSKALMNVIKINYSDTFYEHVSTAVSVLLNGFVIALPTDTVYGIAGLAQNDKAIRDIYRIKKRNSAKPLAICVGDVEDVYLWGKVTVSDSLLKELLPGPVTLIFERTDRLNPSLNPDTNLVGIRIPDNEFIQNVVKGCSSPLALTSANVSNEKSPLSVEEFRVIWDSLEKVFDAGTLGDSSICRRGSTIIDLSQEGSYRVVRRGSAFYETSKVLRKYGLIRIV